MFEIRPASAADVDAIAAVHVACWKSAYRGILEASVLEALRVEERARRWQDWISGPGVHVLVAVRGSRVIGFTRLCPAAPVASPPESSAEVSHLYVDPSEQGGGIGLALLTRAFGLARESGYRTGLLWVLERNAAARAFYERFGLTPDGARHTDPAYLGNDAVEVRYRLDLAP
jgi:GNAT superfamily N-acetyltransferase